jgi:hypothetical protein
VVGFFEMCKTLAKLSSIGTLDSCCLNKKRFVKAKDLKRCPGPATGSTGASGPSFTESVDDALQLPLSPSSIPALFRASRSVLFAMALEQLSSNAAWGGVINKYKTQSAVLGNLDVQFNVFLPKESHKEKVPVLYYLAGLTCTEDTGYATAFKDMIHRR